MRMTSSIANGQGRKPRQARAELRRDAFLHAAAGLIGETGYEAATMTAIAERAGASIGALYDYFPDKRALALVLLERYANQVDAYWLAYFQQANVRGRRAFADHFVEGVLRFVQERPAYLPLVAASLGFARSTAARKPLRLTIAKVLQTMNPELSNERAFLSAQVLVELMKSMIALLKQVSAHERQTITEEFKTIMTNYLTDTSTAY